MTYKIMKRMKYECTKTGLRRKNTLFIITDKMTTFDRYVLTFKSQVGNLDSLVNLAKMIMTSMMTSQGKARAQVWLLRKVCGFLYLHMSIIKISKTVSV